MHVLSRARRGLVLLVTVLLIAGLAPGGATAGEPGPPAPVAGLRFSTGDGFAHFSWDPPADDGGSPVTGYRVSRKGITLAQVGPGTTSARIGGVWCAGSERFEHSDPYEIVALNALGASPPVRSWDYVWNEIPDPVQGLRATTRPGRDGTTDAVLTWTPPQASDIVKVEVYILRSDMPDLRCEWTNSGARPDEVVAPSATGVVVDGLYPGKRYSFWVLSVDAAGARSQELPWVEIPGGDFDVSPEMFRTRAGDTSLRLGQATTLRTSVAPHYGGRQVLVQQKRRGGTWRTVAKPRLSSRSTLVKKVRPARRGYTYYRVRMPAGRDYAATTSRTVRVRVR